MVTISNHTDRVLDLVIDRTWRDFMAITGEVPRFTGPEPAPENFPEIWEQSLILHTEAATGLYQAARLMDLVNGY